MMYKLIQKSVALRPVYYSSCNLALQQRARYSVLDSAKDIMKKANKKVGEAAAEGIEKAENVTPTKDTLKNVADTANKKTGEVLAEGVGKAEKITQSTGGVKDALNKTNKKTGETLADGIDKAEKVATKAEAKKRVVEHSHGYKDLQDKGSKVESEQKRPDDGM